MQALLLEKSRRKRISAILCPPYCGFMFEVPLVTSVVHDPDSIPLFAKIGVQALADPQRIIAEHLFRAIEHPTIRSLIRIGEEAEVFEVRVAAGAPITGKTLAQAAQEGLFKEGSLIVAIEPSSGGNPVVPGGSSRVAEGDRLTVYSETGATAAVTDLFGHFEGNLDEGGTDQE